MKETEVTHLRNRLLVRRAELESRLHRVRENIARPLDRDAAERAKELEDADVVDRLGSEAREEIGLIRHTLERMDVGTYGRCAACGGDIDEARLEAYPYAQHCIDCAEDEEKAARAR